MPAAARANERSITAARHTRGVAARATENFSVLSFFVPRDRRDDVAAVYAFCRGADDIADSGSSPVARAASLAELARWRLLLAASARGEPTGHPVFDALAPAIARRNLPVAAFEDLLAAFEQDQSKTRYDTWEELVEYSRCSANPVGRLVLALGDQLPADPASPILHHSDATCTALQLANFWQDVRRDLMELDRVYLPAADTGISGSTLQSWIDDPGHRDRFAAALRPMVERTRQLMQSAAPLPGLLDGWLRPAVSLFQRGGLAILNKVERNGFDTLWRRPRLSRLDKAVLILREAVGGRR